VTSARLTTWILPAVITVLALADGALHLTLDIVLFRGNFLGRLGPPPGAPQAAPPNPPPGPPVPLPLPLNQMFLLNFVGYVVLVALFWFVMRRLAGWRGWMDALFIAYVALVFLGWVDFGAPNPLGLGYLSKGTEIVLLVVLCVHAWMLSRTAAALSATHPSDHAVLAR
jgi:heme A synthase